MDFNTFKEKFQKEAVEEYVHNVGSDPQVSVCIQTYQHKEYIKNCLDGVLMQETNFLFEILLGEDSSSDGTREICIEYAKQHPDKIRLFLHKRANNIAIGGQPTGRFNYLFNLYSARGKYIACCEGDDHWTDKRKLQKQFDVMEANPLFSGCFHDVKLIRPKKTLDSHIEFFNKEFDKSLTNVKLNDFIKSKWLIAFCSIFFRRELFEVKEYLTRFPNGDFPLYVSLLMQGDIYKLEDTMGVYRNDNLSSLTNNRDVLDRLQFELEKLKYVCELLSYEELKGQNYQEVFKSLSDRIDQNQKLTTVLQNNKFIKGYLKWSSKLRK